MSFTIFQNEKTPFQAIKTRSSKRQKIDIFPNGLTHGFGQKMAMYPTFFFRHYSLENVLYDILARKKPFKSIKKRSSKSRKIDIFPNGLTHRFGPKMTIFSSFFFFQAIYASKMSFTIFQNKKTPFQAIKTRNLKRRKIDIFPKRLTHAFWSNDGHFSNFSFLGNIGQENVFYDILEQKNSLLGYRNKKFKNAKI